MPGQLETEFKPGESIWTKPDRCRNSELNLSLMKHWSDGNMNTWKFKYRFIEATRHFGPDGMQKMRECSINPQRVVEVWRQPGCKHYRTQPELVTSHFFPTFSPRTAQWYYTPVAGMETPTWGGSEEFEIPNFRTPTLAYHGTSMYPGWIQSGHHRRHEDRSDNS